MRILNNLLENLQMGRQVNMPNFYDLSIPDYANVPVTFVPYESGELKLKDLVVVKLDPKVGLRVAEKEA